MAPSAYLGGEGRQRRSVAPDRNQVGRHPADRLKSRALGVAQHRTGERCQPAIKDPRSNEDIGAAVARTDLQRLVTVSRGEGADATMGAQHLLSLPFPDGVV